MYPDFRRIILGASKKSAVHFYREMYTLVVCRAFDRSFGFAVLLLDRVTETGNSHHGDDANLPLGRNVF
jgi:hypothetical protein